MADEKKDKFKLAKEFKAFISKGNVLDMAVGLIIGSAFTAIVNSCSRRSANAGTGTYHWKGGFLPA